MLHVSATNLSIGCVNPQALAQGLRELKVMYKSLNGCDIFEVVTAMSHLGKAVRRLDVSADSDWSSGEVSADSVNWEVDAGVLVTAPESNGVWRCPCGACLDCLQ